MERRGYIASSHSFKLRSAFHFLKKRVWDVVVASGRFMCCFEPDEFDFLAWYSLLLYFLFHSGLSNSNLKAHCRSRPMSQLPTRFFVGRRRRPFTNRYGAVRTHTRRSSIVAWGWRSCDYSCIWFRFAFHCIWERRPMMFPFCVSKRSYRNRERAHVSVPRLLRAQHNNGTPVGHGTWARRVDILVQAQHYGRLAVPYHASSTTAYNAHAGPSAMSPCSVVTPRNAPTTLSCDLANCAHDTADLALQAITPLSCGGYLIIVAPSMLCHRIATSLRRHHRRSHADDVELLKLCFVPPPHLKKKTNGAGSGLEEKTSGGGWGSGFCS